MIIALILYILGFGFAFYGFEETDEDDSRGLTWALSILWPAVAAGLIIYMIYKTFKNDKL